MKENIAAQQMKSEIMSQISGNVQHGSGEAKIQSFLDKHFPHPTDTDLVQEAKSRQMAMAGQVHPNSFEAKFQEFADYCYPQGGSWAEPGQIRSTHGYFSSERSPLAVEQEQKNEDVKTWRDMGETETGGRLMHFADLGNPHGGQGYVVAIDNSSQEQRRSE